MHSLLFEVGVIKEQETAAVPSNRLKSSLIKSEIATESVPLTKSMNKLRFVNYHTPLEKYTVLHIDKLVRGLVSTGPTILKNFKTSRELIFLHFLIVSLWKDDIDTGVQEKNMSISKGYDDYGKTGVL